MMVLVRRLTDATSLVSKMAQRWRINGRLETKREARVSTSHKGNITMSAITTIGD